MPPKPTTTTTPRCHHGQSCPWRLRCKYLHSQEELAAFHDDNDDEKWAAKAQSSLVAAPYLRCDCNASPCICNDMDYWCGAKDYGKGQEEEEEKEEKEWAAFETDDGKWHVVQDLERETLCTDWVRASLHSGHEYYVNTSTWKTMWDINDHDPDDDDDSPNPAPQVLKIKCKEYEDK